RRGGHRRSPGAGSLRSAGFDSGSQRRRDRLDLEGLEDVARLDVGEAVDDDAALEALADLLDVLLEDAERRDRALVEDDALADDPDAAVATDEPGDDATAGDDAEARDREERPDLG